MRATLVMVGAGDSGPSKLDRQPSLFGCPLLEAREVFACSSCKNREAPSYRFVTQAKAST